jgi:hypothetical protein
MGEGSVDPEKHKSQSSRDFLIEAFQLWLISLYALRFLVVGITKGNKKLSKAFSCSVLLSIEKLLSFSRI